jgi:malonyl-CoA decarboxylase
VIEDLRRDLPRLQVFATLSPVPGFRPWLERGLAEKRAQLPQPDFQKFAGALGHPDPGTAITDALARPDWASDARLSAALREPMEKLCARYLLLEKAGTHPADPVAQFHLNNGALVNRIYWLADTSSRGLHQSYGMMVSYRYELAELDDNHEEFQRGGRIPAARRVQRLVE